MGTSGRSDFLFLRHIACYSWTDFLASRKVNVPGKCKVRSSDSGTSTHGTQLKGCVAKLPFMMSMTLDWDDETPRAAASTLRKVSEKLCNIKHQRRSALKQR